MCSPHNIYSKEKKNKILKWFEDVFIATSGEDQLLQQKEFEKALKTNGVSENINSTYIYMYTKFFGRIITIFFIHWQILF